MSEPTLTYLAARAWVRSLMVASPKIRTAAEGWSYDRSNAGRVFMVFYPYTARAYKEMARWNN